MLDEKDKKILDILHEHAEYTTRQIAKKTLIPATTINNRIQKLKKLGIIKKYTVQLDHTKVNMGFAAYVLISVDLQTLKNKKKTQYDILSDLRKQPHIIRADIVSGGTDIVAFVRVKDVQAFDNVLLNKIQQLEGISHTQSYIVIHED